MNGSIGEGARIGRNGWGSLGDTSGEGDGASDSISSEFGLAASLTMLQCVSCKPASNII